MTLSSNEALTLCPFPEVCPLSHSHSCSLPETPAVNRGGPQGDPGKSSPSIQLLPSAVLLLKIQPHPCPLGQLGCDCARIVDSWPQDQKLQDHRDAVTGRTWVHPELQQAEARARKLT